jgi:hypothetical protein
MSLTLILLLHAVTVHVHVNKVEVQIREVLRVLASGTHSCHGGQYNFPFLNDSTHIYLIFKLGLKGAAISFVSGFKIVTTLNLIYDHM